MPRVLQAAVIINADDFGLTDGVCTAIHELLGLGAISSTSLMVAAPGAIDRIRRMDGKSLAGRAGVHLQLTSGSPLARLGEVASLVGTGGSFADPRTCDTIVVSQVLTEWRRQIEMAADCLGDLPTHLDTHHGMHRDARFTGVYADLALEYGIPVRGAVGLAGDLLYERGVSATRSLVRSWTASALGSEALGDLVVESVANRTDPIAEVVTHPGYVDAALREASSLSDRRAADLQGLVQLARSGRLQKDGVALVSFREAAAQGRLRSADSTANW